MHKFIEYISDLLFLHDCVIIPDFGGFICNYKSAYIDESTGVICPPSKDILFNRNLIHNDGLLVNWIACKENISYEKATTQLSLFCEDLKIRLNQKQRVGFGDIGVFFTDRRFNIIFEPARNNFFAEAFGMEPIETGKVSSGEKSDLKPANPAAAITQAPDMSAYINLESRNFLHRMLKYALAVGAIAGIIVIMQLNIIDFDFSSKSSQIITNTTTVQPNLPGIQDNPTRGNCSSVISPSCDYVDYDPISDLNW